MITANMGCSRIFQLNHRIADRPTPVLLHIRSFLNPRYLAVLTMANHQWTHLLIPCTGSFSPPCPKSLNPRASEPMAVFLDQGPSPTAPLLLNRGGSRTSSAFLYPSEARNHPRWKPLSASKLSRAVSDLAKEPKYTTIQPDGHILE